MACLLYGIYNYTSNNQTDALYNDNFTSLLEQQSVYIALLINFAIFIIGYQVVYKRTTYPFILTVGGIFLLFITYLLGSRINIGVLAIVIVGFGFYYLISNKKLLEIATLCLGLIMAGVIIYKVQPQMLNRFKELTYNKYEYSHMGAESHYGMELTEDQWNGANFRLAAWRCGWEIFTENPVVGVGLGDKKDKLFSKYEQKDFRFAIETGKNVHSNYLDVLYGLGIIGFAIFVFTWVILPFMHAFKNKNWLAVVFIFTLACAWVTEIYFDRSLGGMVAGFFIPFILIAGKEKE
ncbi:O-antigen ligase family protein [Pontibacter cellulosilyticus]|uniref:O-antigen ligase family protein n=1 Tax=Pontibacter cellulosilyticus TaxID=1720253 RepID=A0A923N5P6_9BACT|nr:O-antigen ligase family protein [Pontibacter cellulosilyticus]MBC5992309.1 O-antigen ligase family protein [Pontibacter cellulosilyticus]